MSKYILYTDKNENFKCDISLEGAKLKDTFARLLLKTNDVNVVFEGRIESGGKCIIPIKPLKNILEPLTEGKILLEVVADDTYFKPWESEFITKKAKNVQVKVQEQSDTPTKPKLVVEIGSSNIEKPKPKKTQTNRSRSIYNLKTPVKKIYKSLSEYGVNIKNLNKNKSVTKDIINEYFSDNPVYLRNKKQIINGVIKILSKKK